MSKTLQELTLVGSLAPDSLLLIKDSRFGYRQDCQINAYDFLSIKPTKTANETITGLWNYNRDGAAISIKPITNNTWLAITDNVGGNYAKIGKTDGARNSLDVLTETNSINLILGSEAGGDIVKRKGVGGTLYKMFDSGNSNLATIDWKARDFHAQRNVYLDVNNTALIGKTTGGVLKNILSLNSSDKVSLGDATLPLILLGSDITTTADVSVNSLKATGNIVTGDGGGSVALTVNDGGGQANLTFNHTALIPDNDGSSARWRSEVDGTTASMALELADDVTAGVAPTMTPVLQSSTTGVNLLQSPSATTPTIGDNSTRIATTSYVKSEIDVSIGDAVDEAVDTAFEEFSIPEYQPSYVLNADIGTMLETVDRESPQTYYKPSGKLATMGNNILEPSMVNYRNGFDIFEARTNLILHSGKVGDVSNGWGVNNATVSLNSAIAPNGELEATEVVSTIATLEVRPRQDNIIIAAGKMYTFYCMVKAPENHGFVNPCASFFIRTVVGGLVRFYQNRVVYSLLNNNFLNVGSDIISHGAEKLSNGWVMVHVTVNGALNTGTVTSIYLNMSEGISNSAPVGAKLYYWGAQMEVGSTASPYIPTEASQVTRQATNVSVATEDWFNPNEGTFVVEFDLTEEDARRQFNIPIVNGGSIYLRNASDGTLSFLVKSDDAVSRSISALPVPKGRCITSMSYNSSKVSISVNGGEALTSSVASGQATPAGAFEIGRGGVYMNSSIYLVTYHPKALTDAELQSMSQL